MIRKYQPACMIINNTGLNARGEAGHIELDSVTYERGMPTRMPEDAPKYLAGEMCEVMNSHWGYAAEDIAYMADWANTLPRRILGYRTPDELFEAELDRIYAL